LEVADLWFVLLEGGMNLQALPLEIRLRLRIDQLIDERDSLRDSNAEQTRTIRNLERTVRRRDKTLERAREAQRRFEEQREADRAAARRYYWRNRDTLLDKKRARYGAAA
jgi:hypothetical protein